MKPEAENSAYASGEEPINRMTEPSSDMAHVSEFVASLTDEEFAFLQSEVEARQRGEMDPNMKTAEEVEFDLETLEDTGATRNQSNA